MCGVGIPFGSKDLDWVIVFAVENARTPNGTREKGSPPTGGDMKSQSNDGRYPSSERKGASLFTIGGTS